MTADAVTILRARGRRLAKLIGPDGIQDYDQARTFDLFEVPTAGMDALAVLLRRLLRRPDCCVVRGAIADPAQTCRVRRLAYPDPKTGDPATLRETPRRWLALDVDGVPRPEGLPAADLEGCARLAAKWLPAAFDGARCIVQATAGHGIKPGCRVRLWYWLSRPTTGAELKRWLTGAAIDPAVFRTCQLIYTAAPVFTGGMRDHLPVRLAELPGAELVAVPSPAALAPPARPLPAPLPTPDSAGSGRYAFAALRNATVRVATAAVDTRHATILREARGLARFVPAGLLSEREIRAALGAAAEQAGKTVGESDAVVDWALAHPSTAALPAGVV